MHLVLPDHVEGFFISAEIFFAKNSRRFSLFCRTRFSFFFSLNFLSEEAVKDSTDNVGADSHEVAPTLDKESDEEVEDSYPALSEALARLGLPEYVDLFEAEEMDMETFVSCRLRPTVSK